MDGMRGVAAMGRRTRRRRLTAAAASGAVLALASASLAFAEPVVGTGGTSAEGTYLAVSATGPASSSQGVAVSGTGSASGQRADVELYGARALVYEPVTGAPVGIDNTGDARVPTTPEQVLDNSYVSPVVPVAMKEAWAETALPEVMYQVAAYTAGLDPTLADRACPDGTCFESERFAGVGLDPQQTAYWCGPASVKAVLDGVGGSADQATLARELNTTRDGTWYKSVVKVLNARQNRVTFTDTQLGKDSEPGHYMTRLVAAVNGRGGDAPHPIVNNVKTTPFLFWGGESAPPAWHFNVSYGYNFRSGGAVYVAEIYNSAHVGARRQTNPYGWRTTPLETMYRAIRANKGIFIW